MRKEIPSVFGSVFAKEMPITHYKDEKWSPITWQASDHLTLHPASHVLHYGSEIFEGMKAFRHQDQSVHIFQLDAGVARMRQSAKLMQLPIPPQELLREIIIEAVRRAEDEVPDQRGALYIRPALIGTEPNIGSAGVASKTALLFILCSPVGDYFKQGSELRILIETKHQRCAPHMGSIKTGGNYASALYWTQEAAQKYGAKQVLFCPNGDIQETGASNFMLIDNKTIITKPLTSEFLHGITRMSILKIAKEHGYQIEERNFNVDELKTRIENGAEAILTGTAAVISPVTHFILEEQEIVVKAQKEALNLRKIITDIQYGLSPDTQKFLTPIH